MFYVVAVVLANIALSECQIWSSLREPPMRWKPPPMASVASRDASESWLSVPVDNFDPTNKETFKMRYLSNPEFATADAAPILIMVGGEWTIDNGFLQAGHMYEIAKNLSAYMFYTEHRYYGLSRPVKDLSTENLQYLSVDQALADLANFVKHLRDQPEFSSSKIVLFGGSYAGNMVLWFKQRYPNIVDGVVSSSAPVLAEVDFWGYLQVVQDTLMEEGGQQCIDYLMDAISEVKQDMRTAKGRQRIARYYSLCHPPNSEAPLDIEYFYSIIPWTFSNLIQTAEPGTVTRQCEVLLKESGTPFEGLAKSLTGLEPGSSVCSDRKYSEMLDFYNNTSYDQSDFEDRIWYYQMCTEFAYFQTSPRSGTVFDGLLSLQFYEEVCKVVFGDKFNHSSIMDAVEHTNAMHGGLTASALNAITVHGLQDPWHALGLTRDMGTSSPTYLVPKASHCFDMSGESSTDTELMVDARRKIRHVVASWVN